MNAGRICLAVALVAVLLGCSPSAIQSAVARAPATAAAPSCTTADGKKIAELLKQHASEWEDAFTLARRSSRITVAQPVSQLQRIRRDVQTQTWPECALPAQKRLVAAMNAYINGFLAFMAQEEENRVNSHFGAGDFELRFFQLALADMR